jgi:uncharacterized protein (TIGR02647 family)
MLLEISGIDMSYTPENRAELEVLMLYQSATNLDGIKIHKTADPAVIAAAERLFEGSFITQIDGGYLTQLGSMAAEHAHLLFDMLNARIEQ